MSFWELVDKHPEGFGVLAFVFIIVGIPAVSEALSWRRR